MTMRMNGEVGFEEDVKPLFRSGDRDCMLGNSFPQFDLWNWEQVSGAAGRILVRLKAGDMPPDGPWPKAQVDLFETWVKEGTPKHRGLLYSAFFTDLDSYTEYWDVYRPELNGKYMNAVGPVFQKLLAPWRAFALAAPAEVQLRKDALLAVLNDAKVKAATLLLDQLMMDLLGQHFSFGGPGVDSLGLLDAVLRFGADLLPLDPNRDAKVAAGDPRKPFAKFHRMDGAIMWFNWAAHLEGSVLLLGESDAKGTLRTALMASICGGCSMDFTFRDGRLPTRPEYKRDDVTAALIHKKSEGMLTDWGAGSSDCHELFGVAAKPMLANKFFTDGIGRNLT